MRKILVAGNWKMNASSAMVEELLDGLLEGTRDGRNVDMAVFPPFPYIAQARSMLDGSVIAWGGNDLGQITIPSPNTLFLAIDVTYWLTGYDKYPYFTWETWPGFYAAAGFVACTLLVLISKFVVRPLVMRKEDYYK